MAEETSMAGDLEDEESCNKDIVNLQKKDTKPKDRAAKSGSCNKDIVNISGIEEEKKLVCSHITYILTSNPSNDIISCNKELVNFLSALNNITKTAIIYTLTELKVCYSNLFVKMLTKPLGQLQVVIQDLINKGILQKSSDTETIKTFQRFLLDRSSQFKIGHYHIEKMIFFELSPRARQFFEPLKGILEKYLGVFVVNEIKNYHKCWLRTHEELEMKTAKTEEIEEKQRFENLKKEIIRKVLENRLSFQDFVELVYEYKKKQKSDWIKDRLDVLIKNFDTYKEARGWHYDTLKKTWGKYAGLTSQTNLEAKT